MNDLQPLTLIFASAMLGIAVCVGGRAISQIIYGKRKEQDSFELSRRSKLRQSNACYRLFEPLIDELAEMQPTSPQDSPLAYHLKLCPGLPPWGPREFMATNIVEAVFVGLSISAFVSLSGMVIFAVILGGLTGLAYPALAKSSVVSRSKSWLKQIKLRLPFAIDQISLMMEAGAGFEDSLKTVVNDNPDHPLSIEFAEVIRQLSLGRPRSQALNSFRDRLADDDISEIIFAITKGEELGTPLGNILREQAAQMRIKRSQWGEKAAAEAEVQMVFPGMITMVACLLVIVAPIMLPVVVRLLEG